MLHLLATAATPDQTVAQFLGDLAVNFGAPAAVGAAITVLVVYLWSLVRAQKKDTPEA